MTEIEWRNDRYLTRWHARKVLGLTYPDAWSPGQREYLRRRYWEKREMARRWLFKSRCLRRAEIN